MLTEEEREAQRKLEREKIREEIKRMREAQNYEIKKPAESAKEILGYFYCFYFLLWQGFKPVLNPL